MKCLFPLVLQVSKKNFDLVRSDTPICWPHPMILAAAKQHCIGFGAKWKSSQFYVSLEYIDRSAFGHRNLLKVELLLACSDVDRRNFDETPMCVTEIVESRAPTRKTGRDFR